MADLTGGTSSGNTTNNVLFSMDNELFTFSTDSLPNGYTRRKSANFIQTPIIGAQNSVITFANSSPLEISVPLLLAAFSQEQLNDIISLIDGFMACVCPIKNGIEPPAINTLNFGGNGGIGRDFEALLVSVDETLPANHIYSMEGDPMDVTINLSFIELTRTLVDAKDWIKDKGKKFEYLR